jgi:hypothetical protein
VATLKERIANLSPAKQALLERRRARPDPGDGPGPIPIQENRDGSPLSFAQQRLWLVHQLDPGGYVYNVPRCLRIRGRLDLAALERSLNEIVRRHEVLRTTFPLEAGSPVQRIGRFSPLRLMVSELPDDLVASPLNTVVKLAMEEYQRPFDLSAGPLLRTRLWRLDAEDHVLLLTMHHIVSDAWTAGILFEELAALYGACSTGDAPALPELPIQYADYAVWQRRDFTGARLEKELGFWEGQLDGAPALLKLPADRSRPAAATFHGALESVALSRPLAEKLTELSRREGVTLFMTLLAGFALLLSRCAGSVDLVIGSDFANRTRVETERLIGFFVNLLPLRLRPAGDLSFRAFMAQVKDVVLAVHAHQDFPFEKLVETLKPERGLNYHPIVQVLFVMQNARRAAAALPGLDTGELELPVIASKFDLAVFVEEKEGSLAGSWLYSTDLFDRTTILKMAGHFENLLESAAANPDSRLGALQMLSQREQVRLEAEDQKHRRSRHRKLMTTVPAAVAMPPTSTDRAV